MTAGSEPPADLEGQLAAGAGARSDDVEARSARSRVAAALFGGDPDPIEVGRYVVESRIGAGGMGVVYRAQDPELQRAVAVKLVRPDAEGSEPQGSQARLLREARALAKVAHPNVIHVYDVGTVDDGVFIAMELVEGQDFSQWLAQGRQWDEVLRLLIDAGRGLEAAHAAGLVHRDFKPENVLVGDDGRVRVVDFGLAGARERAESGAGSSLGIPPDVALGSLTRTGVRLGTPRYMAPEHYDGSPSTELSDQFAFCVSAFEALYGQPPFEGDTWGDYTANVLAGRVRTRPRSRAEWVPLAVHAQLLKGLAADPAARHASISELLDGLADELRRYGARTRRRWRAIRTVALLAVTAIGAVSWAQLEDSEPDLSASTPSGVAGASADADAADTSTTTPDAKVDTPETAAPLAAPDAPTVAPASAAANAPDPGSAPGVDNGPTSAEATTKTPAAAPAPAPARSQYCYFDEDSKRMLQRSSSKRRTLRALGQCWSHCRAHPDTARLRTQGCTDYAVCGRVDAALCE